jgi:hypothetical protein
MQIYNSAVYKKRFKNDAMHKGKCSVRVPNHIQEKNAGVCTKYRTLGITVEYKLIFNHKTVYTMYERKTTPGCLSPFIRQ